MKSKNHYVLHLPTMLRRHGTLVSTLTNERRHRVVKRSTRPRRNLQSFDIGVVEDITTHQLWEMEEGFLSGCTTAKPSRRQQLALHELFPHAPADSFTLHSRAPAHDGSVRVGDVALYVGGQGFKLGTVELTFSVYTGKDRHMYSIVSPWNASALRGCDDPELGRHSRADTSYIALSTCDLVRAMIKRPAADGNSVLIYLPWGYR
jgi:hypothetical protein